MASNNKQTIHDLGVCAVFTILLITLNKQEQAQNPQVECLALHEDEIIVLIEMSQFIRTLDALIIDSLKTQFSCRTETNLIHHHHHHHPACIACADKKFMFDMCVGYFSVRMAFDIYDS